MIKLIRIKIKLLLVFLISFLLYYPSLFGFYTNDDFYHLKISHARSFLDFVNFFSLVKSFGGQLLYRPLTTHVFYFLGWQLFNLNPIGLHIVAFVLFFFVIYCVYKLALLFTENEKLSLIAALLYATSATHFGHLYYLATEIILGAFFFPAVIFFAIYLKQKMVKYYWFSIVFFVLALLAKENSVVLPGVFGLTYVYFYVNNKTRVTIKNFLFSLLPFVSILLGYFYFHFFYYGFVRGDSYVWNFFPLKALNTAIWYGLWSFNLPEMLVDFVGPGLHLNPNLIMYWGNKIIPIIVVFFLQMLMLVWAVLKTKILFKKMVYIVLFSSLWFFGTLLPVLFLPLHKFTFYLTLPLFGVVLIISSILERINKAYLILFCLLWVIGSALTLKLTRETNWITQGETIARKVFDYINANRANLDGKTILFYDTPQDKQMPFSPTETLKNTLSDNNFFEVFYNGNIKAVYNTGAMGTININSRIFLGY